MLVLTHSVFDVLRDTCVDVTFTIVVRNLIHYYYTIAKTLLLIIVGLIDLYLCLVLNFVGSVILSLVSFLLLVSLVYSLLCFIRKAS